MTLRLFLLIVLNFILATACEESTSFQVVEVGEKEILNGEGDAVIGRRELKDEKVVKKEEDERQFVFDPETSTYSLTVQSSTVKPLTDLYLIVDNSYSMTSIQAQTAATVHNLIDQVGKQNLNLNVHLFTTTDLATGYLPNLSITPNFTLGTGYVGLATEGAKANASFGGRTFFKYENGSRVNIGSPLLDSPFWIDDKIILGNSMFSGATSENGSIKIRETDSEATITAAVSAASLQIANLGNNGSDVEQPLAAMYRIVDNLAENAGGRHAFWIVSNEDDQTRKSLLRNVETEVEPQSSVSFYGRVRATRLSIEYNHVFPAVFRDGVEVTPSRTEKRRWTVDQWNCKSNNLCGGQTLAELLVTKPCTGAQLQNITTNFNASNNGSAHTLVANGVCEGIPVVRYKSSITSINRASLCTSINPNTNLSYEQSLAQSADVAQDVMDSTACERFESTPYRVKTSKRIHVLANSNNNYEIASAEIGTKIIEQLNHKVGPRGYSVAVIANDGVNNCQQQYGATADRLFAFLATTSTPKLKTSVCSNDYWSVVGRGILDFVSFSPVLNYTIDFDATKIKSIQTVDTNGVVRTVERTDYTIVNNILQFKSGLFQINDKLQIAVYK